MGAVYVFTRVALLCLHCAESNELSGNVSLETRVRWIERLFREEALINSQRYSDLESSVNTKLRAGIEASADGVCADFEKRLGDMKKDMNVFKEYVSDAIKRLGRWSTEEKFHVRKTTAELTKTLLEAVGNLNDTFIEFRKDILSRKEVLVTEPPIPKPLCLPGWFQLENRCYLYVKDKDETWHSASRDCQNRGGKLAEPKTPELHDKLVNNVGNNWAWLGGTDEETEGVWVWSETNEPISYSKWRPGEPEKYRGNQDCLVMGNKVWYDNRCTYRTTYLCEKTMDNL